MSFIRTGSPDRDADAYFNSLEERLARMPRCTFCRNHIQAEKALYIDGDYICEDCEREYADDIVRMIRDDYLEDVEEE